MNTSKSFDLALFVGTPGNINDGVVIQDLGPPFDTKFTPMVTGLTGGITVGSSIPRPTGSNQILVSGPSPNYDWELAVNPAVAATVPPPQGPYHVLLADATPSWQDSTLANMLSIGGAVTTTAASVMQASASLTFLPTSSLTTCLDGTDPTLSAINNFAIDCGTF